MPIAGSASAGSETAFALVAYFDEKNIEFSGGSLST
jgi:hypothetical protein